MAIYRCLAMNDRMYLSESPVGDLFSYAEADISNMEVHIDNSREGFPGNEI